MDQHRYSAENSLARDRFSWESPPAGRLEPSSSSYPLDSRHQPLARNVQICQPAADMQPVGILRQSPLPDFGPSEDPLDHQERMFNFGTDLRLRPIPSPLLLTQRPMAMRFRLDKTLGPGGMALHHVTLATVG
jgi:hypothetical protein